MPVTRLADSTLADTIRAGLRPNEAPWPLPPLIFEPEHWSAAPAEVAAKLIEGLARHVAGEGHWLNCEPLSRVRTLPLLCYREGKLCEAQTRTFEGRRALVTFIACDAGTFVLTGQSRPLHALNIAGPKIDLSEPENATQYLKLFCAAVQGEEGPFRIVERLDDFQLSRPFTDAERGSIAAKASACFMMPPRK